MLLLFLRLDLLSLLHILIHNNHHHFHHHNNFNFNFIAAFFTYTTQYRTLN